MNDELQSQPRAIVGLGASAGGLGALEEFFDAVPNDTGLAFVVVTHQHPKHVSVLAELLGRHTAMPVVSVSETVRARANHVYTVAPGFELSILDGTLEPMPIAASTVPRLPIDRFFRSLAQDQGPRAVGIILSGTGSDGSLGLKAINGQLGMVMVQDEQSAEYRGMPHSAITTAAVDYVLPVDAMPARLVAYTRTLEHRAGESPIDGERWDRLEPIFVLIRDRLGHDFSHYKSSTVRRRIERRMNVHQVEDVGAYVDYLQKHGREIEVLFKELLIGVTSFFRDPEAWEALGEALLALLANKPEDYVLRAWVAGCSTGEEAYSLAILLRECIERLGRPIGVQIFATDLDADAIDVARAGAYPSGIGNDVSLARLARFFTREDDVYRVRKDLREMLVFAPQNVISDPPFTKLDLLSCRNLLIYLDRELQQRLLPLFHYALRPGGLMLLGTSESISTGLDLFDTVDKKWKIFRRREVVGTQYIAEFPVVPSGGAARQRQGGEANGSYAQLADRALLRELVPPTVLVRERGDVVHIHGRTGRYLEPPQGMLASANIFNMARDGLQITLTALFRQAANSKEEVVHRGVRVRGEGVADQIVDVRVKRLTEPEPLRGLLRVTFEPADHPPVGVAAVGDEGDGEHRVSELELELRHTKESHQGTVEELETSNEELKSTNEELQSTNEELQSANEELETSKEEMQSLNEELQTVNAELQGKVEQLSRAHNDMKNLLNGTDIATVFLDSQLNIKRYTDQAKSVIRLIPSDVGRSIGDLVSTLHYDKLLEDAQEVLRTLVFKEIEVHGNGNQYLLRILPYRTTDNVIDGLVLTFVDITRLRVVERDRDRLLDVLRQSPTSVFGLDLQRRYAWAGGTVFGRESSSVVGRKLEDVLGRDDAEALVAIAMATQGDARVRRQSIPLDIGGQQRRHHLYVEPWRDSSGHLAGTCWVATDVTEDDSA